MRLPQDRQDRLEHRSDRRLFQVDEALQRGVPADVLDLPGPCDDAPAPTTRWPNASSNTHSHESLMVAAAQFALGLVVAVAIL
jgi:hypothetical protein